MTTTITRTGTVSTPSRLTTSPVWAVCAGAAAVGAVALYAYGAAAQALSVPMRAGGVGATQAQAIGPSSFSIGVLFSTFLGTILAVSLARWAKNPAGTFLRSAIVLTAVSLVFPLTASYTPESTRITLAVAHLVAAAIIVPMITRRLAVVRRNARS